MIIFGGVSQSNEIYLLNLDNFEWKNISCSGDIPSPRYGSSCEVFGNNFLLIGGKDGKKEFNDIYLLNLGNSFFIFARNI